MQTIALIPFIVPRRYIQKLPEGTKSPDDGKTILMNATLGGWLTTQRIEKANGRLKSEREALLQYLCNQGNDPDPCALDREYNPRYDREI